MQHPNEKNRILFIDAARFLAMSLVFYGHFVERIMYLGNPTAAAQYKFIYSFHMVVFFILSGYVGSDKDVTVPFGKFLKHRLLSRLLPFAFFTILFMIPAGIFPGEFFHLKLPSLGGYMEGLKSTLFGVPLFCVPSWFILLIFSVELVHYLVFRFLDSDAKIVFGIAAFYVIGFLFNWMFDIVNPLKERLVGWNYLFIHEAVPMYAFYLSGVLMRRRRFLMDADARRILLPSALGMFFIVFLTYRFNRGFFSFPPLDAVVILFSSHGHFFWFPLTAAAGSLMILFLARAIPPQRTILLMGQNTLILMCLNGIFYHYINPPAAVWVVNHLPGNPLTILAVCTVMTLFCLALCIPFIHLFNKWIPQLVGKPRISGPLLRNLI